MQANASVQMHARKHILDELTSPQLPEPTARSTSQQRYDTILCESISQAGLQIVQMSCDTHKLFASDCHRERWVRNAHEYASRLPQTTESPTLTLSRNALILRLAWRSANGNERGQHDSKLSLRAQRTLAVGQLR